MKPKEKLTGAIRDYLNWPIVLSMLLICMDISIFLIDAKAGMVMLVYLVIYLGVAMVLYRYKRNAIIGELVRYAADYSQVQRQLLKEMKVPYGLIDMECRLMWGNNEFLSIIKNEKAAKKNIYRVIPDITPDILPKDEQDVVREIVHEEKQYRLVMRRILSEDFITGEVEDSDNPRANQLVAIYLFDETEVIEAKKQIQSQRQVVGLLYIDNYEEALESIDEVRRSLLMALIDRKINKYMQNIDAIIKKLEKDKYIIVFQQKYLEQLQTEKFCILQEIRDINMGNEMSVTISIGLGVGADKYLQNYDHARAAIDLALGRGGDQVVIKHLDRIQYYGGKSVQIQKNTRVKARVKAHALKELIEGKEKVLIMGHSIGDVDSFGASVGIHRIARALGKKAYIVVDKVTSSVEPILTRFKDNLESEEDVIISGEHAIEMADTHTLVVVLDVNRPSYTECPELLTRTGTVVVLDHHRQTEEKIPNAVLSYIESYASSTCEMVAEILQYINDGLKLRPSEADALYAGIMIDTNNFLTKAGVRTFEAAAYLRRNGADITKIRKMLRSDLHESQVRAEAVGRAELFMEHFMFAECKAQGTLSPTVIGAQVANELLDIANIKASFVFTDYSGKIYISARSIDELNVQVLMEKLGGGGHLSVAGAQLKDCSIEEAKRKVKDLLVQMKEEGEL